MSTAWHMKSGAHPSPAITVPFLNDSGTHLLLDQQEEFYAACSQNQRGMVFSCSFFLGGNLEALFQQVLT